MANLYIVATPIGNLRDISSRALEVLKEVDLILCEDTRVTKRLTEHYAIQIPLLSYHEHSKLKKINYILGLLEQGKDLALVSDAGTPGILDPGNKLINQVLENFSRNKQSEPIKIIPIPGPSALIAAASIACFPMDKFVFMGFPPTKRKRKKFFKEAINSKYPVIFYESPYRILKTLDELKFAQIRAQIRQNSQNVVVCRELTKKFETIYQGTIENVIRELKKSKIKGEFVVIIQRNP